MPWCLAKGAKILRCAWAKTEQYIALDDTKRYIDPALLTER